VITLPLPCGCRLEVEDEGEGDDVHLHACSDAHALDLAAAVKRLVTASE